MSPLRLTSLCLVALGLAACSSGGNSSSSSGGNTTSQATTTTTGTTGGSGSTATAGSSGSASSSTVTSSSSASSSGAASTSSSSGSSGSTAATTSGSSSGTSTTTGSGSSGGSTGGLTYAAFCAQFAQPLCDLARQCGLAAPDAGSCADFAEVLAGQVYQDLPMVACSNDASAREAAGMVVFQPAAGQACLDALAAAGCSGASLESTFNACSGATVLSGAGAVGSACEFDTDCLVRDAGPVGFDERAPGCNNAYNTFTCGGVCALGALNGESCDTTFCGAGQGPCINVQFADGGAGNLCAPFVGDGGACDSTYYPDVCNGRVGYCGDAGLSTNICMPYAADGGSCDLSVCGSTPAQCPCVFGSSYCQPDGTGAGICQPLDAGAPCSAVGSYPCSVGAFSCNSFPIADGGAASFCVTNSYSPGDACNAFVPCSNSLCSDPVSGVCLPVGGVGDACNPQSNSTCTIAYANEYQGPIGLLCAPTSDGGGECVPRRLPGDLCGNAFDCELGLYCHYDLAQDNTICSAQLNVGDACDASEEAACSNGVCAPLTDGGSACQAPGVIGGPCLPNLPGVPCENQGYCSQSPDGGGICYAQICD